MNTIVDDGCQRSLIDRVDTEHSDLLVDRRSGINAWESPSVVSSFTSVDASDRRGGTASDVGASEALQSKSSCTYGPFGKHRAVESFRGVHRTLISIPVQHHAVRASVDIWVIDYNR